MRKWAWLWLSLGLWQTIWADRVLELRREYNQVAARIDTLVRLYGGEHLERLERQRPIPGLVPEGMELVLIFWADDEAEIYLNGHRIGSTRLTATQVEIPSLYVRQQNILQVNCWDTDRVESGFMAGLYLRDGSGLRQVLVTGEGDWWAGQERAQGIYYTHDQPDIPGAGVIWGSQFFGEVSLQAAFDAAALRQVARRPARQAALDVQVEPMESHLVVSNLVQLQQRRGELAQLLQRGQSSGKPIERYKGYVRSRLAFTLGHAAPFVEKQGSNIAEQLHEWAQTLAAVQQDLVFGERRELKGREAATKAREFEAGGGQSEGRRQRDYRGPPERGPGGEGGRGRGAAGGAGEAQYAVVVQKGLQTGLIIAILGLVLYLGGVCRQWWRLFSGKVWKQ